MHSHDSSILYLVLNGGFKETYDRKTRIGSPSMLILSPAGERHVDTWFNDGGSCFSIEFPVHWNRFSPDEPSPLERSRDFAAGEIVRLAWRLYREFQNTDLAVALAIEGLTLEILAKVARDGSDLPKQPGWLPRATDFLHDHFRRNLSLSEVAGCVGIHPTHLARVFRRHYHCTVGDYVRHLRLGEAREALTQSRRPLSDIALMAGYSDQSHFSIAFKRYAGMSPAEYRRLSGSTRTSLGGLQDR
jgi:AraC family transcriptional regulator